MELASKFSNKKDIFGDIYHANPNQFQFRPGDIKLIEKLVEHVKKIADGKGINSGLSHFNNKASNTATTTKALQGEDECSDTKTHYFLKKLISAANRNAKREKGGYRYDEDIKLYAAYLRMIIGPLAYETLQRNLNILFHLYHLQTVTSVLRDVMSVKEYCDVKNLLCI